MFTIDWMVPLLLFIAVLFDVLANFYLKKSDGFSQRIFGFVSIFLVMSAFVALSFLVKRIDLSIAYSLWGGFGIIATVVVGIIFFKERLNSLGWLGVVLLIVSMSMVKFG